MATAAVLNTIEESLGVVELGRTIRFRQWDCYGLGGLGGLFHA